MSLARTVIADHDEDLATVAMAKCGVYLSAQTDSTFDSRALMALASGMRVLVPESGAYPEIIPGDLQAGVMYQRQPDFLASALQELELPPVRREALKSLAGVEAGRTVAAMDDRLSAIMR